MNTEHNQDFTLSNCDDSLCRICCPEEDFTGYSDFEGYCMTNHGADYYDI